MTQASETVNTVATIAPLRNVMAFTELVDRVMNRTPGLPGMATFHGPSGYGKTFSAIYAANKHKAYHVQMKSVWTRKKLCQSILQSMGILPAATIPDMMDQIGEQLALSRRPLIIDEADYLLSKGMVEVARDIYESSQGAIILIGEEQLPTKLKAIERVHGRMLDWVPAEEATLGDAGHLARLYCPGVEVAPDLLSALYDASAKSIRRIVVNLDRVREAAQLKDLSTIGLGQYGSEFFTGAVPGARRAA
ncbi:AAA family ATPase [Nitrospirillum viridazoti]|uniref:AAA domain-containing protein n=1 Tax=Nitrospirillum amazonense TaxID=28077 RepID=A0A560IKJ0_9PROT|nr:ATP-binding protein [Nitrospirillum amazonense]TWB58715.1 AAA domain-containing protein [Nitrospirillum amazonense]